MRSPSQFIWPIYIRIIHWVVAVSIFVNFYFLEEGDPPHRYVGYVATGFVFIRLILGFFGTDHIRFSTFPLKIKDIKEHINGYLKGPLLDHEGHNPLSSYVYFFMWILVILLAISGWMMGLDAFWGDETLEEIHEIFSKILEVCVLLHLIGISLDAFLYKRKTWLAMIRGYK